MWCLFLWPNLRQSIYFLALSSWYDLLPSVRWPLWCLWLCFRQSLCHWLTIEVESAKMICLIPLVGIFLASIIDRHSSVILSTRVLKNCASRRVNREHIRARLVNVHGRRWLSAVIDSAIKCFIYRFLLGHFDRYWSYKFVGRRFQATPTFSVPALNSPRWCFCRSSASLAVNISCTRCLRFARLFVEYTCKYAVWIQSSGYLLQVSIGFMILETEEDLHGLLINEPDSIFGLARVRHQRRGQNLCDYTRYGITTPVQGKIRYGSTVDSTRAGFDQIARLLDIFENRFKNF